MNDSSFEINCKLHKVVYSVNAIELSNTNIYQKI